MVPLKIFRWLLIIVGIICLFTDEVEPAGAFVMIGIGVALLLVGRGGNNTSGNTSSTPKTNDTTSAHISTTTTTSTPPQKKFCPNCGTQLVAGAPFCQNCGQKVS